MGLTTSESATALEPTATTQTVSSANAELPGQLQTLLPDKPLITIERSKSRAALNLRELWSYRELLYFLTLRDLKVRYKQTALGVLWVILQPLLTMLVFTILFGRLAGFDQRTGGIPYPIFTFSGLLLWTFFATAITNSGNSLVGSAHLITKIYFPRMLIPAAVVMAGLVDFSISFAILAVMMLYYGVALTWGLLLLPALVILVTLLALGVGMLLSALNVKYRDIRQALPFMVQIWMFLSPVIYPATMVQGKWRWVLALNPMTGIIEGFRAALFGRTQVEWNVLAVSGAVTVILFSYSLFAFRRMEKSFADVV
jgi:lipopolysaccharide transport system permease protein